MSSDFENDSEGKGFSEKLLQYTRATCYGDFLVLLNRVIGGTKRYDSFCEFYYEVNEYWKKYCPKINKVFSFTSQRKPKGSMNLMDVLNTSCLTRIDFFRAFLDKLGGVSEEYSIFCETNSCERAERFLYRLYQFLSDKLGNDPALFHPLLDLVMKHKIQSAAALPFFMRTLFGIKGLQQIPGVIKIPVEGISNKADYPQIVFGAGMPYYKFQALTGQGLAEYQGYIDSCLNRGSAHVEPKGNVFFLSLVEPGDGKTAEKFPEIISKEELKLCSCVLTEAQKGALEVLRVIIGLLEGHMDPSDGSDFLYDTNKSLVDNRCAYVKFLQQPANFTKLLRCVWDIWDDILPEIQSDLREIMGQDDITEDDLRQYDRVWNEFPRTPHEQRLAVLMSRWIQQKIHFLESSDPRPVDDLTLSKYVFYTPIADSNGRWMSDYVKDIARRDVEHLKTVYADRLRQLPSAMDIPFWSRLQSATADQLSSAMQTLMSQSCYAQNGWTGEQVISCLDYTIQPLLREVENILKRKKIPQSHGAAFFLNNILTVCSPELVRETLLRLIKGVIDSTDTDKTILLGDEQLHQAATDFVRFSLRIGQIEERLEGIKDSDQLDFDHVGNSRNAGVKAILGADVCEEAIDYWRQQRNNFLAYDPATHTYPHLFTVFPFYYDFMPEMPQNSPEGEPTQLDS